MAEEPEEEKLFNLVADIQFRAKDPAEVFVRLRDHFGAIAAGTDPSELFRGRIRISPVGDQEERA